jgi:hypothetical protein
VLDDPKSEARTDVSADASEMEAHLDWQLREIMGVVKPRHLRAAEKAALVAVLAPIHARLLDEAARLVDDTFPVLGLPSFPPSLRVVRGADSL